MLQLRKEISKHDPFRWANVTDHEQHMTNAKCCDEDSPFLWRYRSRLQPEHYPGPVYDAHLTDWAPTYDDHAVFYLDINRSEQAWTPVLNHVSRQVEQKVTLNWNLPETDKTYQAIAQLVPWTINRIQIARTPKARRLPLDIPVTHRACVLVQNDGTVAFESDHLMSTPYCSSRFAKPVSFAIFVYGHAPEDGDTGTGPAVLPKHLQQAEEAADDCDDDIEEADIRPSTHTYAHGIRFVGLSREQVPAEIRSIVARMHLMYGHPPNKDLIHFVAQQGASLPVILCIRALQCDSCIRKQAKGRAQPAKLPDFLQISQPFDRI